ncbi:MAG: ArgE/DapE family deacylase [Deltaproteobacteria bacterium]|nr:ArgE/DapE family deacylase [Deltaproteobacteria bacterium]
MPIDERELLKVLQDLIRIESINPELAGRGSGEYLIAQHIGRYLAAIGLEVRYQEIKPKRVNVIGVLKGSGEGKSLMLNGHTDTVGITRMDIEPLNPVFRDGKVYGRGSFDMKGGLAAIMIAVKAIIEAGLRPQGDIILAFVADEEYLSLGTEVLVREYPADAAILCEPTNLKVCIAHKGFAWIKVEVFGKAAHGSRPDRGIDAIVKAGKFLARIEELGKEALIQKKHPLLGSPSIHASLIKGGTELSTYPDYCLIELERRFIPGESVKTIEAEMQALIDDLSSKDEQFKAQCQVSFSRPPLEVARDHEIVGALTRAYNSTLKKAPQFIGVGGWMDSAILAEAGIPSVIIGPAGEGFHAATEYVDFESVITLAKILADTIIEFCGV